MLAAGGRGGCGRARGEGLLVGDVAQSLVVAEPTGTLEHCCRKVHTQRAASHGGAGRLTRGLARPAADVEHAVAGTDAGSGAESLVVQTHLGVEQVGVPAPVLAGGLIGVHRRLGSVLVGHHPHRTLWIPSCLMLALLGGCPWLKVALGRRGARRAPRPARPRPARTPASTRWRPPWRRALGRRRVAGRRRCRTALWCAGGGR